MKIKKNIVLKDSGDLFCQFQVVQTPIREINPINLSSTNI